MITEQDVRAIYDGFYKIAEVLRNRETTQELSDKLRLALTSFLPASKKVVSEESEKLFGIIEVLNMEYQPRFDRLMDKQEQMEITA